MVVGILTDMKYLRKINENESQKLLTRSEVDDLIEDICSSIGDLGFYLEAGYHHGSTHFNIFHPGMDHMDGNDEFEDQVTIGEYKWRRDRATKTFGYLKNYSQILSQLLIEIDEIYSQVIHIDGYSSFSYYPEGLSIGIWINIKGDPVNGIFKKMLIGDPSKSRYH